MIGLTLLKPRVYKDERGYFFESYRQEQSGPFVQDNVSFSVKNTIRALHFQKGQAKFVQCLWGAILDVVVDIRVGSKTFGKWESFVLDDVEHQQLLVPDGFAHGFCVLSEGALVQYKVSTYYDPKNERSIRWNDPDLNIQWPIKEPVLSERDRKSPYFKEVFCAVDYRG